MSRACRHCQNQVQRLRSFTQAVNDPGSRTSAPWILRSRRGSPQFTPNMGPDATVLERPDREMWRARSLQAKTAAFSGTALRHTPTYEPNACRREAGKKTFPPLFLQHTHPP